MSDYHDDIPIDLARAAHRGTSFVPDDRARQERDGYASQLAADLANLSRYATTDEKRAILAEEFARYREGFRSRYVAHLAAKSRCMSTMITGRSNFPVRQQEKRGSVADKRCAELLDFRTRALKAIERKLRPEIALWSVAEDRRNVYVEPGGA